MAYLSKTTILKAYELLSTIDVEKQQGLTQKVSALRYLFALDRFYKKNGRNCDTKTADKNEYVNYVGEIVGLSDAFYTSNFYTGLYTESDYKVGSNFFSVNAVKDSLVNTSIIVDFPRRNKDGELFKIQNGVLLRDDRLFKHIDKYLLTKERKIAFALWICRSLDFWKKDYYDLKRVLKSRYSEELIESLLPSESVYQDCFSNLDWIELFDEQAQIYKSDIIALFEKDIRSGSVGSSICPKGVFQKIFYGTPGSGKSNKVKKLVEDKYPIEKERDKYVFRTTFHPDSDYASFVGCYKPRMVGKDIEYKFTAQVFTLAYEKAWQEPEKQVYLIIEEINRGNCAQIFGDLFQLLDRKGGVSEYPINADADLKQHLEEELGSGSEGIKDGKLKLPANLNILATMNTSDQSLFPMDSAFKRRWSWECVPIDYEHEESSKFNINIDGKSYGWNDFLKAVNKKIVNATDSEDKQMGNFFINGDVDDRQFIDKVMFYLWNDICKEEYHTNNNFFRNFTDDKKTETKEFSFNQLFESESTALLVGFMDFLGVNEK